MEHATTIRTNTTGLAARCAEPSTGYRSAGYYVMLVVLLTGLALAFWAVVAVHTGDVPAVRNHPGYNIEDAVDGCGTPTIGSVPEPDAAVDAGPGITEV